MVTANTNSEQKRAKNYVANLIEPGVGKRVGGRGAPRRVGRQQAADDVLRARIHARPVLRREAVVALQYVRRRLLHGLVQERRQLQPQAPT